MAVFAFHRSVPGLAVLHQPRSLTTKEALGYSALLGTYAVIVAVVAARARHMLPVQPAFPVAHAMAVGVVCALTSLLLYGVATDSRRSSDLLLAATYQYVAMILLFFPLVFPGAFRPGRPLLGGAQSAPFLYYAWHVGFLLGALGALYCLWRDQRTMRRSPPHLRLWPTLLGSAAGGLVAIALAGIGDGVLPRFLRADGPPLPLGHALDIGLTVLGVCGAVLAVRVAARGGLLLQWLALVLILLAGESVVTLNSQRWELGWYFNRLFGGVALTALLMLLVIMIGRVARQAAGMALTDAVTGIENRASITSGLAEEFARSQLHGTSLAVIWLDIDGFKVVNDQIGPDGADSVLVTVADRLAEQLSPADRLGRPGGDEFAVVLCDGVDPAARASECAANIVRAIRAPIEVADSVLLVTPSVGVARFPGDAASSSELRVAADLAMYAAKAGGGDRVEEFHPALVTAAAARAQLRHDLSAALHAGAFDLEYQPIYDAETAQLAGAEALVRWVRDGRKVTAGEFIEFAEQSGQILGLGRMVLSLLERDLAKVTAALPPEGFVSFNLSARELGDDDILSRLAAGPLRSHADRLVVEVTESLDLHDIVDGQGRLALLRSGGYRIAIDDFGTGFSNFARLGQLHPQMLKLDRSLVVRAGRGERGGKALLEAAAGIADNLGCAVIAEGVETDAEHAAVTALGIRLVQGFRYSRPVGPSQLLAGFDRPAVPC